MTFEALRRSHAHAVAAWAFVLFLSVGIVLAKAPVDVTPTTYPHTPTRVERIIERHGCWTSTAPAGVIPGHAVVSRPGHLATLAPAGPALDAVFGEGHRSLTVHAFCR